jgi:hypothetical protein
MDMPATSDTRSLPSAAPLALSWLLLLGLTPMWGSAFTLTRWP